MKLSDFIAKVEDASKNRKGRREYLKAIKTREMMRKLQEYFKKRLVFVFFVMVDDNCAWAKVMSFLDSCKSDCALKVDNVGTIEVVSLFAGYLLQIGLILLISFKTNCFLFSVDSETLWNPI